MSLNPHTHRFPVYDINTDIMELLATKTYQHISIHEWVQTHRDSGQVIQKNALSTTRQQLLQGIFSNQLHFEQGAFHSTEQVYNRIVELYTTQHGFDDSETLWWKLSSNNRRLWKHNQVWTLSPLSVYHSQSPLHIQDLMIAHIPERHIPFTSCVAESAMGDFLPTLEDMVVTYNNKEHYQKVFAVGDWMTHCCELNCTPPNTTSLHLPVCWRCGIDKQYFRTDWLEDPFYWQGETMTLSDFPDAAYHFLPLDLHQYCMMHGVANMVSNCLKNLYCDLPLYARKKGDFKHIMAEIQHSWEPDRPLIPRLMKEFFHHNLTEKLSCLYELPCKIYSLKWPTTPHTYYRKMS